MRNLVSDSIDAELRKLKQAVGKSNGKVDPMLYEASGLCFRKGIQVQSRLSRKAKRGQTCIARLPTNREKHTCRIRPAPYMMFERERLFLQLTETIEIYIPMLSSEAVSRNPT